MKLTCRQPVLWPPHLLDQPWQLRGKDRISRCFNVHSTKLKATCTRVCTGVYNPPSYPGRITTICWLLQTRHSNYLHTSRVRNLPDGTTLCQPTHKNTRLGSLPGPEIQNVLLLWMFVGQLLSAVPMVPFDVVECPAPSQFATHIENIFSYAKDEVQALLDQRHAIWEELPEHLVHHLHHHLGQVQGPGFRVHWYVVCHCARRVPRSVEGFRRMFRSCLATRLPWVRGRCPYNVTVGNIGFITLLYCRSL